MAVFPAAKLLCLRSGEDRQPLARARDSELEEQKEEERRSNIEEKIDATYLGARFPPPPPPLVAARVVHLGVPLHLRRTQQPTRCRPLLPPGAAAAASSFPSSCPQRATAKVSGRPSGHPKGIIFPCARNRTP